MIKIDGRLKRLGEEFDRAGEQVYAVGGYVRNQLIGLPVTDIDISGTATYDRLNEILTDTETYSIIERSRALGTVEIHIHGDGETLKCEYTTFRRDSYRGGEHTPSSVSFTRDINEDALRRDFTVNAIYADLLIGAIKDPVGGIHDVKTRILRTVCPGVFTEDGLRIMRLFRFAAQLDWDIDGETLKSAKANAELLTDISAERIFEELRLILTADTKYSLACRRLLAFHLNQMSDVYQYIFGNTKITEKETALCAAAECDLTLRCSALLINSDDPHKIMTLLKAPKQLVKDVRNIVEAFRILLTDELQIKRLIIKLGRVNAERLIELRAKAGYSTEKLNSAYEFLKTNGILDGIKGLEITGDDCINRGLDGKQTGAMLNSLLNRVLTGEIANEREELLKYLP